MSVGDNFKKKVLNNSDLYNYYKEGYETYKSNYEKLIQTQNNHENDEIILNKRMIKIFQQIMNEQEELKTEIDNLKIKLNNKNTFNSNLENNYNNKLNHINNQIQHLNDELNNKNNEISNLNNTSKDKDNQINQLKNDLNNKNNEIRKLRVPFSNFDEYLIESYIFPLVRPPFSEEAKRCFSVMEEVASYLISKANEVKNKPLISVIMPVYNRKDVVMNAIDSVLAQTYANFELIVVDDASTDGTTELLKTINNEKVKIIFHEKNKYASGARNTGLKASKGEYIAYLDSDNLLDERYLAATVGAFLELPDAGGIYSAQYRYETYESKPFAIQFGSLNKSLLHNHNFVDMNCFAHRREVYEDVGGFDETLKGADDWELILKISNHFKIYSVPFLLSKCYLGVVDNRVSDLIPTDMGKIRAQNEILPTKKGLLNKKVSIIIPIYKSLENLNDCINSILSLNLDNIDIIISNNVNDIDLFTNLDNYDTNNIKIIQSSNNKGFTDSLNQGISYADINSDILILSQNAILTEGSLESLQKHAYKLEDCGLVVSQQVLKNGSIIQKHVPYAHDDYWCDVTPSNFYKNILKIPIFHNGEFLELKMAPFFCTYLKREIFNKTTGFNDNLGNHFHSMRLFSEYIRQILKLNIYHISEAVVINNISNDDRNKDPINDYDYMYKNFNSKKYIWDS